LPNLIPASPVNTGNSGDWVNEIHLNLNGFRKLGRAMGVYVDNVLAGY
jgi:hypothetical protein